MTPTANPPPPPPGTPTSAATSDPSNSGPGTVPPPPGRVVRRSGDRVVAGVAAGIGRHYGIDPVLVRILFVITTFAAGLGALAYLVLWIVLPKVEGSAPTDVVVAERGTGFWVGAAVVTVGGAIALANLPAPRLFIPLALVAIGAALWQRPGTGQSSTATVGRGQPSPADPNAAWEDPSGRGVPSPGSTAMATTGVAAGGRAGTAAGATPGSPGPAPDPAAGGAAGTGAAQPAVQDWQRTPEIRWWVPPEPRPRPSWLGPIVVALALLVTGIVAALGVADVLAVRGSDLVAVALLVLAGGLLVGTLWGRAKWLAFPASALAGVLVALQLVGSFGVQLTPRIGEQDVTATRLDSTLTARHGVGEIEVDVADAVIGDEATIDLDLGIGHAVVVVPDDVTVQIDGQVGIGAVHLHVATGTDPATGEVVVSRQTLADGRDLDLDAVVTSAAPDAPIVRIDVAAGIGAVDIYRGREVRDAHRRTGSVDEDAFGTGDWFGDEGFGGEGSVEQGIDEPMGSGTVVPVDPQLEDWFLDEVCPVGPDAVADMVDCWSAATPDGDVVELLVEEGGFFADICVDRSLIQERPDLVGDCLAELADAGARFRTSEGDN